MGDSEEKAQERKRPSWEPPSLEQDESLAPQPASQSRAGLLQSRYGNAALANSFVADSAPIKSPAEALTIQSTYGNNAVATVAEADAKRAARRDSRLTTGLTAYAPEKLPVNKPELTTDSTKFEQRTAVVRTSAESEKPSSAKDNEAVRPTAKVSGETETEDKTAPAFETSSEPAAEASPKDRGKASQKKQAQSPDGPGGKKREAQPGAGGLAIGSAAQGVGAGGPGAVEQKAPVLDTNSSEGLLQSLAGVPPSQLGEAVVQARSAATQIQTREKSEMEASFPEVERPTGLPRRAEKAQPAATALAQGSAPEMVSADNREGEPPEVSQAMVAGPLPGSEVSTSASEPAQEEGGSWWDWLFGRVRAFFASLPTTDSGVSTSAGPRPSVDLTGSADPSQMAGHQQASDQEVVASRTEANAATAKDFGENDIYPTVPAETLRSSYKPGAPAAAGGGAIAPTPSVPDEARAEFNQNLAPLVSSKTSEQVEQNRRNRAGYEEQHQHILDEGKQRIADENERARVEQQTIQQQARGEVGQRRQQWLEENQQIQADYVTQSEAKRGEISQQIAEKVQSSEVQADQTLTEAETRAETERVQAEARAAEEKRNAESKPRSWWESFKGAVSDALASIRSVINGIFDGLRTFVKRVIEGAKAVVRGIIEAARTAIVGLIKGFGAVLKGLVTIALFAFPEAADRARKWIDKKVDGAVEAVNEVAEALKKATDKILDWIGAALDKALAFFQAAFNLLLDAMEFVVNVLFKLLELLAKLYELLKKVKPIVDTIIELINDPTPAINAIKEFIGGMIARVAGSAESLALGAITFSPPPKDHWEGIWEHLKPKLDYLADNWWDVIKETLWLLIWPFGKDSSGERPLFKHVEGLYDCVREGYRAIGDSQASKATDAFLKAYQHFVNIIGMFYGWIFLGLVIAGGIISAPAGVLPGMAAGAAIAGKIGVGLTIAMLAGETALIAKSGYDLVFGSNTDEENEKDYEQISSSALTIAIIGALSLIGWIAARIAGAIIRRVAGRVWRLPRKRTKAGPSGGDVIELRVATSEKVMGLLRRKTVTWLEVIRKNFPGVDITDGVVTITPRPGKAPLYNVNGGKILQVKSNSQVGAAAVSEIRGNINDLASFTSKGNCSVTNPASRELYVALKTPLSPADATALQTYATSRGVNLRLGTDLPPNHPALVFPDQIPKIMAEAGIVAADQVEEENKEQ
ncbi:MAG TPA: hypothetical protein VF131_26795 [Blastocatellia bacterium]|nr:hypothetical protein [Blastocatellia bacterium]